MCSYHCQLDHLERRNYLWDLVIAVAAVAAVAAAVVWLVAAAGEPLADDAVVELVPDGAAAAVAVEPSIASDLELVLD
jgi:hypothetical protein